MRETEDGFLIAEEDLRLRGAGEVLGHDNPGCRLRLAFGLYADLLPAVHDDARLILEKDVKLESDRGQALRLLLYLFRRDEAISFLSRVRVVPSVLKPAEITSRAPSSTVRSRILTSSSAETAENRSGLAWWKENRNGFRTNMVCNLALVSLVTKPIAQIPLRILNQGNLGKRPVVINGGKKSAQSIVNGADGGHLGNQLSPKATSRRPKKLAVTAPSQRQ